MTTGSPMGAMVSGKGGHRGHTERSRAIGVLNGGRGPAEANALGGVEFGVETGLVGRTR
jgi:hypothetical protein